MDYFYVNPEDITHSSLTIRDDESKHLVRVLRKEVGDRIFATDGNDTMYEVELAVIGKTFTRCDIIAMHRKYNEPHADVTLAVSLLKNPSRFEYLVEKSTELGVRTIIPLQCERTIRHREKHDRLEKIALSAIKQCGRSWMPRILPLQSYETLISSAGRWPLKFIPHEHADRTQTIAAEFKHHADIHSVLIVIGPEGGFSDLEIACAQESGFKPVSLGPRRLRVETAAVAALAQLL